MAQGGIVRILRRPGNIDAMQWSLPLLPLVLDSVPPGLALALRQEGVPTVDVSQVEPGAWAALRGAARERAPGGADTVPGRFLLYDSRSSGHAAAARARQRHQSPLDVDRLRRGWPFDPFEALVDTRSRRAAWDVAGNLLTETVSFYAKGEIRRKLMRALRQMVESRGGVWVKLSAFPYPYRSVMNFRIDHDTYDAADFAAVLGQSEGYEHAVSHFVCASAFENHQQVLGALSTFDVGSHGWWHHTYRDARQNRENICRGIDALAAWGLQPSGFVAPHGRWNPELAVVLGDLGIEHSSEFALAHDEIPFFPYLGRHGRARAREAANQAAEPEFSRVLQLPVHPVCLGLFLEAGVPDGSLIERYFVALLRAKYERGEPILLYGHPTGRLGRYPGLLRTVFATASNFHLLWHTTLSRFATWWRKRLGAQLVVYLDGENYEVHVEGGPKSWRLGIEYWRGDHVAVVPADAERTRFRPEELAYERRQSTEALPVPLTLRAPHGLKEHVRNWLDWETVTPANEIRIDTLPGMLKRGLRQLRRQPRRF